MYTNVLIPTDGSEGAESATGTGLALADRFGATAHTLFVVDERFVAAHYDQAVEEAEREAERALDRVERQGRDLGIDVEKHLRRGIPHEEILDTIEACDVDLVTMGTCGRTGVDRFLHLGSVTERVVRSAPVHVLTVPIQSDPGD